MSGRGGRIPTPVVLASSSAMIAVGLIAWAVARAPEQVREETEQRIVLSELRIDDRTPEAAAESYFDAWRRRAWDEAERIAIGQARARVQAKRAAEAEVHPEDRAMAREVWQTLAGAPLAVSFHRSEELGDGRLRLVGIAGYDLVGRPYRREMEWIVAPEGTVWRVESMTHGRVITAIPDLLEGDE
jgi:hypothetical protein